MNILGMNFNELSHVLVFGGLLAHAGHLANETRRQHGRGVGYAVLGAVVILPTVLLAMFKWEMAVAAWVVKTIVWAVYMRSEMRRETMQTKPNI